MIRTIIKPPTNEAEAAKAEKEIGFLVKLRGPNGSLQSPDFILETREDAAEEAERLATQHPGVEAIVYAPIRTFTVLSDKPS